MLTNELMAFLEGGLDLQLATRDDTLRPAGVRVTAIKVDHGGQHVDLFIPKAGAELTLANLRSNGQAALLCARASDNGAYQLKGTFVSTRAASASDRSFVEAQWVKFQDDLQRIGFPVAATATWTTWPSVKVRVRVTAVFLQTPGPGAGALAP